MKNSSTQSCYCGDVKGITWRAWVMTADGTQHTASSCTSRENQVMLADVLRKAIEHGKSKT